MEYDQAYEQRCHFNVLLILMMFLCARVCVCALAQWQMFSLQFELSFLIRFSKIAMSKQIGQISND